MIEVYLQGQANHDQSGNWAALVLSAERETELYGHIAGNTTAPNAELLAMIHALEHLQNQSCDTINLYSQSNYLLQGIEKWRHKWRVQNWCNRFQTPIANQNLWQQLDQLLQTHHINVQCHYLGKQSGNLFHERCSKRLQQANKQKISYQNHSTDRKFSNKPILLIDGSSLIHRAFHGIPARYNQAGEPVAAIYGVLSQLRKLLRTYKPKQVAVMLDPSGPTTRHRLYPAYKSNRPPMDPELKQQIPLIRTCIEALGLPIVSLPGIEADDVIGTLAAQADANQQVALIVSSDKDMLQLMTPFVQLLDTMKGTLMTEQSVQTQLGLNARQIPDYLALIGDRADHIPGVHSVGPKTASKWLQRYQSIAELKRNTDQIKGKAGEHLRASIDQLDLSLKLVKIDCQLELPYTLSDLKRRKPNIQALRTLFERFEFQQWLKSLEAQAA